MLNILGIGIDIVENKRISLILKKYEKRFIKRILSNQEIKTLKKEKVEFLSKSFAVKEAFVKALGSGFSKNISFKSITLNKNYLGKPFLNKEKLKVFISISHENNVTIAIAVITKNL